MTAFFPGELRWANFPLLLLHCYRRKSFWHIDDKWHRPVFLSHPTNRVLTLSLGCKVKELTPIKEYQLCNNLIIYFLHPPSDLLLTLCYQLSTASSNNDQNVKWYTPIFSEGGEHVHHKVADVHVVVVVPLAWHPHRLIQNGVIEKWIAKHVSDICWEWCTCSMQKSSYQRRKQKRK